MQQLTDFHIQLTTSLIACLTYACVWLICMLRSIGYRRLRNKVQAESAQQAGQPASISVILTTQDQCPLLRERLPLLLQQQHPDFEVVVVDMKSQDDTLQYLSDMQLSYPHLRVCSFPPQSKDISAERLALTLGVRAASKEWVLFTNVSCQPASRKTLWLLSSRCTEGKQMVLGYTRYANPKGWTGLRYRFFRTWQQMLNLTHASRYHAYRASATNLCYRRSFFYEHKGFADGTPLQNGATDIMVNRYSTAQNTAVCLHPDSFMFQDCPNEAHLWNHDRLFFMETRRHLPHHIGYRLRYAGASLLTWIHSLSFLATLAAVLLLNHFQLRSLSSQLAVAIPCVLWLVHACWRTRCFHLTLRALGEESMHLSLPLLLHLVAKWDLTAWLRHRHTNKNLFRKKFV